MINKDCFTAEWITQKSIELKYNDKNLIEKVIRAFSLLEMLAASGCPFHKNFTHHPHHFVQVVGNASGCRSSISERMS